MTDIPTQKEDSSAFTPQWGENAPKGGRAVLNRVLREGNRVPLFLGQTFIKTLRDVGYNDSTSAICEHVDNAIQAGATEVRVYFHQSGKGDNQTTDVAVYDNGPGMPPNVLQVAMSFGGSMHFESRNGIGRFGVGMKTAALSMGPVLEVYSWQEPRSVYSMLLDVNEISENRSNLVELPEPALVGELPPYLVEILTSAMLFPKDAKSQDLLARSREELEQQLGSSGTIVYMPACDRLSYKKVKTLVDHAIKEMSRVYRRQLGAGLQLYINNRAVDPFDPTYWMQNARHTKIPELTATRSKLVHSWPEIQIPVEEGSSTTGVATVRLYMLPIEEWYDLPRKILRNDLHIFDDHTVSFMRNDREVYIGSVADLSGRRHGDSDWLRIQVDFNGDLDEAFGVAMNKQGVRPKKYVLDIIREQIKEDVTRVREQTKEFRAGHSRKGSRSQLSEAERSAQAADGLQARPLPEYAVNTEEERKALDQNLQALATTLKRSDETDSEAFDRIKSSKYITNFKHDPYWPFYHVDYQLGKVILTVNTAHPFFTSLYDPLSKLSIPEEGEGAENEFSSASGRNSDTLDLLTALQMLLLSLARTQSQILSSKDSTEYRELFENIRKEWSDTLKTQLKVAFR